MSSFKPGDWVRYKTCGKWMIGKVSHIGPRGYGELWGEAEDIIVNIKYERDYFFDDSQDIEHWQPKQNEWCWFWNYDNQPALGKSNGVTHNSENCDFYMGNISHPYNIPHLFQGFICCEPYIGQLPSLIKDNK